MMGVDHLADGFVPAMYSAAIDGIFADEEEFFLFGVETATDDGVVEGFYVFVVFVAKETLVYHFFRQLLFVDELVSPLLLELQAVATKGVFVV
jgi:hypothetical protein